MRGMGYMAVWCTVMVIGLAPAVLAAGPIRATIIDNEGTRYEVSDLRYYNHNVFSFSRGNEREKLKFKEIASIEFYGAGEMENRPLQVTLRNGKTIQGTVFVGSAGAGQYVYGANPIVFTGKTDLGPFTIQLRNVKKVILRYSDVYTKKPEETPGAASKDTLWVTIVSRNGTRFEAFDLRPPHRGAFEILQGKEIRRLMSGEIRRIEFMGDDSSQEEQVPVLVTLRDGTTLAGATRVSALRGTENIYDRSEIILSAKTTLGPFAMSLRNVKDITFHAPTSEADQKEAKEYHQAKPKHAVGVDTSAIADTSAIEKSPSDQ